MIIPFKPVDFIDARLTLNGFYDRAKSSHFHDVSFDNENYVLYTRLDNTLKLSRQLVFELTAAYLTPDIQGPADLTRMWMVNGKRSIPPVSEDEKSSSWSGCLSMDLFRYVNELR